MNAPASSSAQQIASLSDAARAKRSKSRFRGRRGRALIVAVVGIVVVIALLATNAFGSSGTDFRTADASYQRVDAVLSGVGTIEPISQATVAFPVSGTVGSVSVKTGDRVDVGQTLAALDTQSLTDTLHQKQATLAQAQLTLTRALAGQSASSSNFGNGTGGSGGSGTTTQSALRTGTANAVFTAVKTDTGGDPQLTAAQQAVLSAQQQVDATTATATTALASATNVCGDFVDKTAKDAASNSSTQTAAGPANAPSAQPATPPTPPPDDGLSACQTAIKDVLTAQNAVADAEKALAGALTTLDNLLAPRAATPPAPAPSQPAPTTGGSGAAPGAETGSARYGGANAGGSGSGGSGSGGFSGGASSSGSTGRSSTPSAADLASYQAAVDAAAAQVAAAQQALSQATIASPIAGTVVAVHLQPGASVTSASTTDNVIVQGDGGFEVSTTIGIDRITHVAVGQRASVVPDGTHTALQGHVSSIGVAPDPNSSTTSYLVVIGLDNANQALHNGSTGLVSIVTQSAKSALAVPTSSITTTRNRHTVEVLDGDTPKTVNVRVGVMGTTWTEIKSGITKGQQVVVADMSKALPGSATSSTNSNQLNTNQFGRNAFINRAGFGGFRGAGGGR